MGKVEEQCRVDCIVVCEENLIWFEGMPVVVCVMWVAAGFSLSVVVLSHFMVVSCRGISFERWDVDILLIDYGKKVDYENSHL